MMYLSDESTGRLLSYDEAKKQGKLYHCCNTCKHRTDGFYKCAKPKECFNGFSAYEPNQDMINQENIGRE